MFNIHNSLASTYSIVAVDQKTGEMGVGVQSHFFAVGTAVPWVLPGVGAIATQALVNRQYGPEGLELLKKGLPPSDIIQELTSNDPGHAFRQLAVVNPYGEVSAYTGDNCISEACHIIGDGFSVQANMMEKKGVCKAMADAFTKSASKGAVHPSPLSRRIHAALTAAEELGGDIRGKQSAAILTAKTYSQGKIAEEYLVDLRVDDHPEPLAELDRLLNLHAGYSLLEKGDSLLSGGNFNGAMDSYHEAITFAPENREMRYWKAVALLQKGYRDEAFELLSGLIDERPGWYELLRRLEEAELAHFPEGLLAELGEIHKKS